jgi:hypothetical protein
MVSKAVRLLVDEGLLVQHKGCKPRFASDAANALPAPRLGSAQRLTRDLRERILNGEYRRGEMLPKVAHFQMEYGVSNRTVLEAYSLLEKEGMLYRSGRARIAGARPSAIAGPGWAAPVVLVVQGSRRNWPDLVHSDRTRPFVHSFVDEARSCGVEVVFVGHRRLGTLNPLQRAGVETTRALIGRLGTRYAGSLLVVAPGEVRERWLTMLRRRPNGIVVVEESPSGLSRQPSGGHEHVAPFDEGPGLALAVERLSDLGHRRVAFFSPKPSLAWCRERLGRLQEIAVHRGLRIDTVFPDAGIPCPVGPSSDAERAASLTWVLEKGPVRARTWLSRALASSRQHPH